MPLTSDPLPTSDPLSRTRTRRVRPSGAALCVLTLLLAASAVHAEPLRLGIGSRLSALPLVAAESRGYLEREELEIELVAVEAEEDLIELLAEEELDLATLGAGELLGANGSGVNLRGAYVLGISGESDAIVARGEIGDIRLLAGRRVAVAPGSAGELLLRQQLQLKGRRLTDVEAVALDPAAAVAAFLEGTVEAAALAEPALSSVLGEEGVRVLATAARPAEFGLISDLLVGSEDTLDANKESMKGLVRALGRAVAWMRRNPEEAVTLAAEHYGIAAERAAAALAGVTLLDVEDNMTLLRGDFQKSFSAMSRVLADAGIDRPREVPSANRYLSLSALRQVAAGR